MGNILLGKIVVIADAGRGIGKAEDYKMASVEKLGKSRPSWGTWQYGAAGVCSGRKGS